jgi:hypothetical protein
MALKINTEFQDQVLNAGFKSCMGSATLKIYGGTRPQATDDQPEDAELVSINMGAFNSASDGFMGLTTQPGGTATTGGIATWFRITSGNYIMDGDVGDDLSLDNTEIQKDKMVKILAFVLHQPGG